MLNQIHQAEEKEMRPKKETVLNLIETFVRGEDISVKTVNKMG